MRPIFNSCQSRLAERKLSYLCPTERLTIESSASNLAAARRSMWSVTCNFFNARCIAANLRDFTPTSFLRIPPGRGLLRLR